MREDDRVVTTRLIAERERLRALLKEWPYSRRVYDQRGYTDALKAWHASCKHEEV